MRYLPSLTPLRGLAALLVVMDHLTRTGADPTVPGYFLRGYLGVDRFLILSGFVLTHVYVHEVVADLSRRTMAAFLWTRAAAAVILAALLPSDVAVVALFPPLQLRRLAAYG